MPGNLEICIRLYLFYNMSRDWILLDKLYTHITPFYSSSDGRTNCRSNNRWRLSYCIYVYIVILFTLSFWYLFVCGPLTFLVTFSVLSRCYDHTLYYILHVLQSMARIYAICFLIILKREFTTTIFLIVFTVYYTLCCCIYYLWST